MTKSIDGQIDDKKREYFAYTIRPHMFAEPLIQSLEKESEGFAVPVKDVKSLITQAQTEARKQAASDILNLANEYANQDDTMVGSEELRSHHYFNAIHKIGEFDGR